MMEERKLAKKRNLFFKRIMMTGTSRSQSKEPHLKIAR